MTQKLYIKQNVLHLPGREKFSVKDQNGTDVYTIQNKLISLHNSLEVYDQQGKVVAKVSKEHLTLRPSFEVKVHGEKYATIHKKISLGRDKYGIELHDGKMEVNGSLFDHNFSIARDGHKVGHVSKARISWGDSYEISLGESNQNLELLAIGIVLVIDQIDASEGED